MSILDEKNQRNRLSGLFTYKHTKQRKIPDMHERLLCLRHNGVSQSFYCILNDNLETGVLKLKNTQLIACRWQIYDWFRLAAVFCFIYEKNLFYSINQTLQRCLHDTHFIYLLAELSVVIQIERFAAHWRTCGTWGVNTTEADKPKRMSHEQKRVFAFQPSWPITYWHDSRIGAENFRYETLCTGDIWQVWKLNARI